MRSAPPLLRVLAALLAALFATLPARAEAPDAKAAQAAIAELLHDFLTNNADPARHARFWADDLVYTSSAAKVMGKADIMQGFAAAPQPGPAAPAAPAYSAEDVLIRPYGSMAALTFRLVAREADGKVTHYRNSGTLLHRDGRWQVVTWQATKVPPAN